MLDVSSNPGFIIAAPSCYSPDPNSPVVELVYKDFSILTIRWVEPEEPAGPIDGYEYAYIKKSPGKTPSNWTSNHKEDRSANLTGLESKTEYEIHVRAFNLNSENEPLYSTVGILTVSTDGMGLF